MKKSIVGAFAVFGVLYAGIAMANDNLIQCRDGGFILNRCEVRSREVAQPFADDEGNTYESEYNVRYSFPCVGHTSDFGLSAGPNTLQRFRRGATELTVVGSAPLRTTDPNPAATRRLSFAPGCTLRVDSVVVAPSTQTIMMWGVEADQQARILTQALNAFQLAKGAAETVNWSRERLVQWRGELERTVEDFPDAKDDLNDILGGIDRALQNQHSKLSEADLERARAAATALHMRLIEELGRSRRILARFHRAQRVIESNLESVVGRADAALLAG